jgi:hypothetical protein
MGGCTLAAPAKSEQVFNYLKQCAHDMRTVTYGELAKAVGLAPTGIGYQLGYTRDDICRQRGLPWLNAIAVNADKHRPGDNFLPQEFARGQDEERMWRGMVLQVFAYDWERVPFQDDASR